MSAATNLPPPDIDWSRLNDHVKNELDNKRGSLRIQDVVNYVKREGPDVPRAKVISHLRENFGDYFNNRTYGRRRPQTGRSFRPILVNNLGNLQIDLFFWKKGQGENRSGPTADGKGTQAAFLAIDLLSHYVILLPIRDKTTAACLGATIKAIDAFFDAKKVHVTTISSDQEPGCKYNQ